MKIASVLLAVCGLVLAACNTDNIVAPPGPVKGQFTVNAASGWVYVSLSDSAIVTPAPSPAESSGWDVALFATNVMLNGGQAGPGAVEGNCICQNAAATNDQVLAMTAESELGDFDAINSVPSAATFEAEVLTPAIRQWYTGAGAGAAATASKVFVVKLADGQSYAKLRFTGLQNQSAANAGRVTIEFAVQAYLATSFGAPQTLQIDLTTGAKLVDLNSGQITTSSTDWDIRLEGFTVRVNGGASGSGSAGAYSSSSTWEAETGATAPAIAYSGDTFAGVFGTHPWFRYNILGDNRISPVFDVYLIRRGSTVWKLQLLNYYSATNVSRNISFRFERIAQ